MPQKLWCVIVAPTALIGAVFSAAAAVATASASVPQPTEARLERRIVGELEAGHVAEAQVDAEAAVKRYPDSAVLRRRHGQLELCLAIQGGEHFQQALEDAIWAQNLGHVVDWLHTGGEESHGKPIGDNKGRIVAWEPPTAEQREAFERFRVFASGPVVTSFQEK